MLMYYSEYLSLLTHKKVDLNVLVLSDSQMDRYCIYINVYGWLLFCGSINLTPFVHPLYEEIEPLNQ